MIQLIFLDTNPLSLLANPRQTAETVAIQRWSIDLRMAGIEVCIPEISDYEVRRELVRAGKTSGLRRLDRLQWDLPFVRIVPGVMNRAALLWADARQRGRPTASADSLDGDCILAALALLATGPDISVTVATNNVGHLAQFVDARPWQEIRF